MEMNRLSLAAQWSLCELITWCQKCVVYSRHQLPSISLNMSSPNFEHPSIDWNSLDLNQEFRRFRNHVSFVLSGPLADIPELRQAGWLGTWIGEQGCQIYQTLA